MKGLSSLMHTTFLNTHETQSTNRVEERLNLAFSVRADRVDSKRRHMLPFTQRPASGRGSDPRPLRSIRGDAQVPPIGAKPTGEACAAEPTRIGVVRP